MKHIVPALLVLSLICGCAAVLSKHSRTILVNPENGEQAECAIDMLRTQVAHQRYKDCISSYEEQGYAIWGQY